MSHVVSVSAVDPVRRQVLEAVEAGAVVAMGILLIAFASASGRADCSSAGQRFPTATELSRTIEGDGQPQAEMAVCRAK